jgi:S1-C subfamily serine protease
MKYLFSLATCSLMLGVSIFSPSGTPDGPSPQRSMSAVLADAQRGVVRVSSDRGRGTGIVTYSQQDGYLVWTMYHVIRSNPEGTFQVRLSNGSTFPGRVIAHDSVVDLAVLSLDQEGELPVVPMRVYGGSVTVGRQVYHVGSPLGVFDGTVTSGVVSFTGRRAGDYEGFFDYMFANHPNTIFDQVSTPTWPGSSGGAIITTDGRVIGLVHGGVGECLTMIVPAWVMRDYARRCQLILRD